MRRLVAGILLCAAISGPAQAGQITVFAAASLKEALDEINLLFQSQGGHDVTMSYAGSSALARQIEFGATADVFISASRDWMDRLEKIGKLQTGTRIDLLSNRLVLIGNRPAQPVIEITPKTDLIKMLKGGRLSMALTEAVPAGIYGKAALIHLDLWPSVKAHVAETDNVRAALKLVALRAAPLGIVYATDAQADDRVSVIGVFPKTAHPRIIYPAAVVTNGGNEDALAFLDYLQSEAAHDVFEDHGFIVIAE